MIVYGASGHGKVIIEILESIGETNIMVWDDADISLLWQYPVMRPDADMAAGDEVVLALGRNATRKRVAERLGDSVSYFTAVHEAACISYRATIDDGTVVMAGVTINADSQVGMHCIINTNASIDHDCVIGDYAHISPNATLSGDVQVGEGTHIGAGAVVIQGIRIGRWCTIGAGAVVIKDIPDYATAVGNPARIIEVKEATDER